MQKGKPKSKIEIRAFSGYTLKNRYNRNDRRDMVIDQLFSNSKKKVRGYKWFSVTPKERNILFQIADQLGPRIGNTIRGVLGPLNAPFQRLIRILFDRKLVWMGSSSAFWQATTHIVSIVYKQSYTVLTSKGGLSPIEAKQIAESSARVFCNFMLTTRLSYQMASYESGVEQPEELSEEDIRALEEAEVEEAGLGEATGINMSQVNTVARYIVSAFRRLRIQQILQGITGMTYRLIAYAFTVNSSNSSNFNWVRYARGTHAYTEIIKAITDIIIENVDEVLSSVASEPAASSVPARRKQQKRSYSDEMQYEKEMRYEEDLEQDYEEYEDEYEDGYYRDEDYEEEIYGEDYEDESYGEDGYRKDYEGESYEEEGYEDEYEEEDYEDEYEGEYEESDEGIEDLISADLEPETIDYELPEYSESTQIEPVYDEDEEDGQLIETLRSIEPSLSAFRLANKFLRTRTFSNRLSLKRNFYNFLVNEFVKTRAFNKKEEKEMEEAAAEIVDKLDTLAEDVKDIRTMLAKAIEAMDVATADEDGEDSGESDDSGSSWDDFWRSDDSSETAEEDEESEDEDEEEEDETADEAESDEEGEGEGEKGHRSYYARLRRYKKRKMRMPKKAAKPTKKPKAKGI